MLLLCAVKSRNGGQNRHADGGQTRISPCSGDSLDVRLQLLGLLMQRGCCLHSIQNNGIRGCEQNTVAAAKTLQRHVHANECEWRQHLLPRISDNSDARLQLLGLLMQGGCCLHSSKHNGIRHCKSCTEAAVKTQSHAHANMCCCQQYL